MNHKNKIKKKKDNWKKDQSKVNEINQNLCQQKKYEMMSYKIIFDASPLLKKDLSLLKKNKKQALLIKEKLEEFAENPSEFI